MNRVRTKTTAIFLLICLAVPVFTTYAWHHYRKYMIKKEVKRGIIAGIPREDLVLLKFTRSEILSGLRWEHSREFEYNRQMYDVVDSAVKGDTIYYWCWWDHEETELNRKLKKLADQMANNDPKNRENENRLLKFFSSLFYTPTVSWQAIPQPGFELVAWNGAPRHSLNFPPPIPPPKIS
ncbi:MAG: hypothetical protein Kow0042_03950 [Calditrichia bacterium]